MAPYLTKKCNLLNLAAACPRRIELPRVCKRFARLANMIVINEGSCHPR